MFTLVYLVKVWFIFSVSFGEAKYQPSIYWDPRNPMFKNNVEINVLQHSKLNIVCPNPASVLDEQQGSIPQERMYENMWIVNKHEYDTCTVNTSVSSFSASNKLLSCNSPLQLKYYPMVFRSYSAVLGGIEFVPGTKYYFIATSNGIKSSLSNYNGGHCVTSNMKMVIYICNGSSDPKCTDAQTVSPSPSTFCAPLTQTVNHCPSLSLSSGISSSVLVQQSSPVQTLSVGTISTSVLVQQSSPVQTLSAGTISTSVLVQQSSPVQTLSAGTISTSDLVQQSSPVQTLSAGTISTSDLVQQSSPVQTLPAGTISTSDLVQQSSPVQTLSAGTISTSDLVQQSSPVQTLSAGTISTSDLVQQSSPVQILSAGTISTSDLVQQSSPVQTLSAGTISTSVLDHQSSPIQVSSAVISVSPTSTALAPISTTAVQCEKATIPEEFYSLFENQTRLLASIYNYTSLIPDLKLLIRGINSPQSLNQTKIEQSTNSTQNCTNLQNVSSVMVQPACPLGSKAPVLRSCNELYQAGYILSGIYRVDPLDGKGGFGVYCDQENGGGWTVFLRRYDGFLSFDRGWNAYVDGLGDLTGEFWVGLATMRRVAGAATFTIRFDLESPDGEKKYAEYSGSKLGGANTRYKITVGSYTGDAGDSFSYHNDMKFSTKNRDNDRSSQSCAKLASGGWWFKDCQEVCLTGKYENGTHSTQGIVGIQWDAWKGGNYSLSRVEMKIRQS